MDRLVLAHSGGADTSAAIPWLAEKYRADVVAVTLDLGQGKTLDDVHQRALAVGATRAHVIDARDEFARDFVLPALQAHALVDGRYPLSTPLSRPILAKHLVEIARIEGASVVAHGCRDAGESARLDRCLRSVDPAIKTVALSRTGTLSRQKGIGHARRHGAPLPGAPEASFQADVNLWGRTVDVSALDDTWPDVPEHVYQLTRPVAETPDVPAFVELAFERGVPMSINGVAMSLAELIQSLQTIAASHGVGRMERIEPQSAERPFRVIYEAPAAVALHAAHEDLERMVVPTPLRQLSAHLAASYADVISEGAWFSPTRRAIDAFVAEVQPLVTGMVRVRLHKGDCRIEGRSTRQKA